MPRAKEPKIIKKIDEKSMPHGMDFSSIFKSKSFKNHGFFNDFRVGGTPGVPLGGSSVLDPPKLRFSSIFNRF